MPKRILFVDDQANFRFAAELALRKKGYKVRIAEDGEEALEVIREVMGTTEEFDLIITDIVMPKVDGIELLDKLRKDDIRVPALVITGFLDSDYRDALQTRGYSEAMEKPFTPDELTSRVSRMLDKAGDQR
jgi:DNA-binding NtrC family response regulator